MKKVMVFLLIVYLAVFVTVAAARFLDVSGVLIMLAVLVGLVIPPVVNDIVQLIRVSAGAKALARCRQLEKVRTSARKVLKNRLAGPTARVGAELNLASYYLLKGDLAAYEKQIENLTLDRLKIKWQLLTYLGLRKDFYFIVNDREKYEQVVTYMRENIRDFPLELKNDIDSDLFIFDLRSGFVDYKHEEKMLNYLKSFVTENKIYDLTYHYALALIAKCRRQVTSDVAYLQTNAHGTFFTLFLLEFEN